MKMRRSTLTAAVLSLPLTTNALSLGDLQEISSPFIPSVCLRAYNSQIAVCTTDDFNIGCIPRCKSALNDKEREVTSACAGLIVNSKSLLGIVQSGDLVERLCLRDRNDPATSTNASPSFISFITSRPAQTTTTTRPPIVVAPSTTTRVAAPISTSTQSTETSTPVPSTSTFSDNIIVAPTTIPPGAGVIGGPVTNTRTSVAPTTTRTPAVGSGGNGSGGGSPFDIESSASSSACNILLSTLALVGWTILFLGR